MGENPPRVDGKEYWLTSLVIKPGGIAVDTDRDCDS